MADTADAIIVGAGLSGAAVAWSLVQSGLERVLIIEADRPGAGASGSGVGLLRSHHDNRPETELACKSMPFFRNWADYAGNGCSFRATGYLQFLPSDELPKARINVDMQREFGEEASMLTPEEVASIAPEFETSDIGGAVFEPGSGTASNSLATYTLLARVCGAGAKLRSYTRVEEIRTKGGRVIGVETQRGYVSTPVIILAAGISARTLAATCGVDLPITGKSIRYAQVTRIEGTPFSYTWKDPITDSWLAPQFPATAFINVPRLDKASGFTDHEIDVGIQRVAGRLPAVRDAVVSGLWSQEDAFAPDAKPIIGPIQNVMGLYILGAAAGKGHKVAPAAAQALSEIILEGHAVTADLRPFRPERFLDGGTDWGPTTYDVQAIGT